MLLDSTSAGAGNRGTLSNSTPQAIDFIKNYLGPTLKAAGLSTKEAWGGRAICRLLHRRKTSLVEAYRDQVDEAFQNAGREWDAVYSIASESLKLLDKRSLAAVYLLLKQVYFLEIGVDL